MSRLLSSSLEIKLRIFEGHGLDFSSPDKDQKQPYLAWRVASAHLKSTAKTVGPSGCYRLGLCKSFSFMARDDLYSAITLSARHISARAAKQLAASMKREV